MGVFPKYVQHWITMLLLFIHKQVITDHQIKLIPK